MEAISLNRFVSHSPLKPDRRIWPVRNCCMAARLRVALLGDEPIDPIQQRIHIAQRRRDGALRSSQGPGERDAESELRLFLVHLIPMVGRFGLFTDCDPIPVTFGLERSIQGNLVGASLDSGLTRIRKPCKAPNVIPIVRVVQSSAVLPNRSPLCEQRRRSPLLRSKCLRARMR